MKYFQIIFFCIILSSFTLQAQQVTGRYRITFTDKKNTQYSVTKPEAFLSQKAIERRSNQQIPISQQDFPINNWYIDSIQQYGAIICNSSKWFNSAIFICDSTTNLEKINTLPFVLKVEKVAPLHKSEPNNSICQKDSVSPITYTDITRIPEKEFYGPSYNQIALLNGIGLHKDGFMGQGMTIAVIDAGFLHADSAEAFTHIWKSNKIQVIKDFSGANINTFQEGWHGMGVLSLIGGFSPGKLVGTAPQATFMLLRSEESATEYTVEQDNWVAAAEFADSAGVDVISTSLGYSEFDDTSQNFTYTQIDGNTTRITIGADIAASKGILLINSAGNSGDKAWKYITAPADADSIITVGACYSNGIVTKFSSRGPTYSGITKPDVMSLGYSPSLVSPFGTVKSSGAGTSFSAPIFAGMATCLWQEFPQATAQEIKKAIIASSDRYFRPDTIYGNGIPNFEKARYILKMNILKEVFENAKLYPNPFQQTLQLQIQTNSETNLLLEMFDLQGNKVIQKSIQIETLISQLEIPEVANLQPGGYIAIISFGNQHQILKVMKSK